jgi:hypothetical protein
VARLDCGLERRCASGGPVLYGSTVVAVNSFVINTNCAGAGFSYRVDQTAILSWINSYL